jgi:hypothetical protein
MCLSGSVSFDAGPPLRATREAPGGDARRGFHRTRSWTRHAPCLDREGGHLEEARKLLDPVIEQMMEAVHHYEGTTR